MAIWRHPIKAHGREAIARTDLRAGEALPWDRHWAVAHETARLDGEAWAPCANFTRGAKAPQLMAIEASLDESAEAVTLTHPARPDLTFAPDREAAAFLDWVAPLMPEGRARPAALVRAGPRGMTDSPFPSISLNNGASLDALSDRAGRTLSPHRFRGNLWLDGLHPWEEFDLVGQHIRIGTAVLAVRERIGRCRATHADPATGRHDTDTLGLLEAGWGHTEFGVYAEVVENGDIAVGDPWSRA